MEIILWFVIVGLIFVGVFMVIGFEIRYGQLHDEWMDQNVTIDLQASQLNKSNKKIADLTKQIETLEANRENEIEKLTNQYTKKIDTYKVKVKGLNESLDILMVKEAGYLTEIKTANEEIANLRDIIERAHTVEEVTPDKVEKKSVRKRTPKKKVEEIKEEVVEEGAAKVEKKRGRRKKADAA